MAAADVDEQSKNEIKDILLTYDRTLLVADPRRCEPKKVRRQPRWWSMVWSRSLCIDLLASTRDSLCTMLQ